VTLTTVPGQPGTPPSDYSRLLVTTMVWIGALTDYEVENAEPLVTASPLTSQLRKKLGAQKLAQLVGSGR
jgi:uncharacterized membrane protein YkgB